ncbi:hypothetical protein ABG067_007177 [Albugo candida]|uniref:Uncharacterized protein n=1 Tax=Albugo candida TaxID=65357 RepID=A0A024GA68_9STRA|nr:unnamed protein product [Albugo candida]|eukprot:CCI43668.1 unnamed protein product [Albugo candida]
MALTDARILDNIADFTTEKLFLRQSNKFMETICQNGPGLLTKQFMGSIGWKVAIKAFLVFFSFRIRQCHRITIPISCIRFQNISITKRCSTLKYLQKLLPCTTGQEHGRQIS